MKPKVLAPLALLVLLFGAGCPPADPVRPALLERFVQVRCDTEPFRYFADTVVTVVRGADSTHGAYGRPEAVLVSAAELNNSQRHDCQRMITGNPRLGFEYGPLIGLFVSPGLTELRVPEEGHVVAEFVNYDAESYAPLGIPPGYSCLWIGQDHDGSGQLAAAIIPADRGCAHARGDVDPALPLEVHRLTIADGSTGYPRTGRWMWDEENWNQFIGIRCGNAWCEIGPQNFVGTREIATESDVPGRFDRQLLAVARDGSLVVSQLMGVIVPGRDNFSTEDPASAPRSADRDLHVATLNFLGPDGAAWNAYAEKFALDPEGPHTGLEIFLNGEDNQTPAPGTESLFRYHHEGMGSRWTSVRRCTQPHSGSGTVRWAWMEPDSASAGDEGFWVPCAEGCCMVRGFGGT